jgi:hypothetical protein
VKADASDWITGWTLRVRFAATGNSAIGGEPMKMTYPKMEHFPLTSAYLCPDCNCVSNCAVRCPACASQVVMSLAGVLDREAQTKPERESDYPYITAMVA